MDADPDRRYFTREEAQALIPRLRGLLTALQLDKRQLDDEVQALARLTPAMRANGHATEAAQHERRIQELTDVIHRRVEQITSTGVEVKDLDLGLVDFPSLREGRVVYLCWRVDESAIEYWHELDAGYRGRQPLDE